MQNAGHLQAPPRQTYQLPASTLIGTIGTSHRNPDGRKISTHTTNMAFTAGKPSENLYKAWRKCVKDQITERNFVLVNGKPASYRDTDFLPIYTGRRALLPACDLIATAVAANNQADITEVKEALVDLIKDCVKKLQDTKKRANGVLANPYLAPAQVTLNPTLLPPGTPVLSRSATVIPNPGQLPQNPLVAIIRGALYPQVQQVNLAPAPQVVVAPQGNGDASGSVLPQAVNNACAAPVAQAQLGNAGVSGSVLPQGVVNPALAAVAQVQPGNGGTSSSVRPQAVVNPAPAPLFQAQPGNAGPCRNVVPVPHADISDNGEDEIVRTFRDNHPAPGRLLQARQRNHQARKTWCLQVRSLHIYLYDLCFHSLTFDIQIGALCLGGHASCESFMCFLQGVA